MHVIPKCLPALGMTLDGDKFFAKESCTDLFQA